MKDPLQAELSKEQQAVRAAHTARAELEEQAAAAESLRLELQQSRAVADGAGERSSRMEKELQVYRSSAS